MGSNSVGLLAIVICAVFQLHTAGAQKIIYADTLHFDTDRSDIKQAGETQLQTIVDLIDPSRDSISIDAHTDADGDIAYNIALSRRRAETVAAWMHRFGPADISIGVSWIGEVEPIADNETSRGKSMNRRAVIKVVRLTNKRSVVISGTVQDSSGNPIVADVLVAGKEFVDSTRTNSDGQYDLLVPDSAVLSIEISSPGHVYETRMFNSGRDREMFFTLPVLEPGLVFQLHRFYFVGNQAVFLKTSLPELGRLLKFMRENPSVEISIEGHINLPNSPKVDTTSAHYDLSVRRARAVYDYLASHGVDPSRLKYAGFGNWQMVYPKARVEDKMRKNRRVEIRIVGF